MRFVLGYIQPSPGIQRIVNLKLPLDVLSVVRKTQTIAQGNGFETGSQWVGLQMIGICGIDDFGHAQQRLVSQFIVLDDHIEGT